MKLIRLLALVGLASGVLLGQTPAGTTIKAELKTALSTKHAHPGDTIQAEVRSDVKVHGQKLWPKGTLLTGTVLTVTSAESDKSPSRITLVFQQATGKGSAPQPLLAAVVKVEQNFTPMLNEPPHTMPTEPPPNADDSQGGNKMNTLGEMPVPPAVTEGVPNPASPRQQPVKIEVTHVDSRGSELLSNRGDIQLPAGTQIELKVLPPPGSGSLP